MYPSSRLVQFCSQDIGPKCVWNLIGNHFIDVILALVSRDKVRFLGIPSFGRWDKNAEIGVSSDYICARSVTVSGME